MPYEPKAFLGAGNMQVITVQTTTPTGEVAATPLPIQEAVAVAAQSVTIL